MKVLEKTEFGNPVLRQKARQLAKGEILAGEAKALITDLRHTLMMKKYGIGLAAPQVGQSVALSVICIRPTKTRPNLPKSKWAELVIINPKIIKTYGRKKQMWEGCISLSDVFAKVPRYKKIQLEYLDESGVKRVKTFEGLLAHVIQHEVDLLHGILFPDIVTQPRTYMSGPEYRKRIVPSIPDDQIE